MKYWFIGAILALIANNAWGQTKPGDCFDGQQVFDTLANDGYTIAFGDAHSAAGPSWLLVNEIGHWVLIAIVRDGEFVCILNYGDMGVFSLPDFLTDA